MSDSAIDRCLAYEILHRPDEWIGTPSAQFLRSLLSGANWGLELTSIDLPFWRIGGALYEEGFVNSLKERFGMADLTCLWALVIEGNFLSAHEGFEYLRREALSWHREYGVSDTPCDIARKPTLATFWTSLFQRPAMWIGGATGWDLYCALIGMTRGCEWLRIPRVPGAQDLLARISAWYSAPYAAFRMEPDARRLLAKLDPATLDLSVA